jgi:hypothetical protein
MANSQKTPSVGFRRLDVSLMSREGVLASLKYATVPFKVVIGMDLKFGMPQGLDG